MKRSYFKQKPRKPLNKSKGLLKRSRLRYRGVSDTSVLKEQIQALLRKIVTIRDGGCWLRHYSEAGACGCRTNAGELILQAEHLHTRSNTSSFSDSRLVLCCCKRHHIFWKPQHSDMYNYLAEKYIGEERTALWKRVREDRMSHKVDLKLEIIALEQELKLLEKTKKDGSSV